MAFAKPVLVVGEGGFSEPVTPETTDLFLQDGFYGHGGDMEDPGRVARQLADLLASPDRRRELGDYGRRLVCERFSLDAAARRLERIYRETISHPPSMVMSARQSLKVSGDLTLRKVRRRIRRARSR
jgi:glycosyltransferase involved in cell wall biosynthesis